MNFINILLFKMIFFVSSYVLATNTMDPILLVRAPYASAQEYRKALMMNPLYKSPIQVFEEQLEQKDIPFGLEKMVYQRIKYAKNVKEKVKVINDLYHFPSSKNLFLFIDQLQMEVTSNMSEDHKINDEFLETLEYHLRRLRKQTGGEDLVLFVNGYPWSKRRSSFKDLSLMQSWTLISSAWGPCDKIDTVENLLTWISHLTHCDFWIQGEIHNYHWRKLGFLEGFNRSIFWKKDKIIADNWFNPYQKENFFNNSTKEHFLRYKSVYIGLGLVGAILFYQSFQGKKIIIQF